jgi:hypothetical protein
LGKDRIVVSKRAWAFETLFDNNAYKTENWRGKCSVQDPDPEKIIPGPEKNIPDPEKIIPGPEKNIPDPDSSGSKMNLMSNFSEKKLIKFDNYLTKIQNLKK